MKAPIPFKSRFDELAYHAQRLEHKDLLRLIHSMQTQVKLDETLPTRLIGGLDDKVKALTLPTVNNGGAS